MVCFNYAMVKAQSISERTSVRRKKSPIAAM